MEPECSSLPTKARLGKNLERFGQVRWLGSPTLHIHQEFFRILKRGGATPQPWERGGKDVVLLSNTSAGQLYVQFRTFTGP